MKTKLLILWLLIGMMMPQIATAESGKCGDNLTWTLENGVLTISGTGAMTNYAYIYSYAPWYSSRSTISLAIISEGVTSIGNWAFSDCRGLTSITIPNSVTSIGYDAFRECSGLTSVTIPNSVTSIGTYAFYGCSGLTSVTIPNSVTSIGDGAFRDCSGLTSVTIPNSVTSIGKEAFYDCSSLTSVTIPNSVTSIGNDAFSGCPIEYLNIDNNKFCSKTYFGTNLKEIIIGNSVTSIGDRAFSECSGLTSITIPNSVTSIGEYAFYFCSGLTSITIPNSVTSIGSSAFYWCRDLTSITIPNSVEWIGSGAFEACPIEYLNIDNNEFCSKTYFGTKLKEIIIGNSVTSIGKEAFRDCSGLTSITIPNSVTSIGGAAFRYCSGLTSITIPNSVTSIGEYTFAHCYGLTSVTIPNSVTSIGRQAFYLCSALKTVTIPSVQIDETVFDRCNNVETLIYAEGCKSVLRTYLTSVTSVTIPNSVTSIGSSAFRDCSGLTSITIPNSVTSIGTYAFYGCSGLTSVTIPNSVTSIGASAFWSCSGLTSVTIPNSVTSIGNYAFSGCSGLTSITIPNSVTSIGNDAFYGCSGLTSITIPNSVTSIGNSAFYACSGLTFVTIPNSVTSIGEYTFLGCSGLTSVTIPNSVTSIGASAFWSCSGLTSITIPNSVTSIGNDAFRYCDNIKLIENKSEKPQSITSSTFSSYNATLIVPAVSLYAYKGAGYWNKFTIKPDNSYAILNENSKTAIAVQCDEKNSVIPDYVDINGEKYKVTKIGADVCTENVISLTIPSGIVSINGSQKYIPTKIIWQTNTPPSGYESLNASINFVSNNEYSTLKNVKVYSYLSSMFEVGGIKFVPINPSTRTCAAIDCTYNPLIEAANMGEKVSYKGVDLSISKVEPYTFYKNTFLKSLSWKCPAPIEDYTFYDCTSMSEITLAAGPQTIGPYAFQNNVSIQKLTIPESVNSISEYAFDGCTSLSNLTLNTNLQTIGCSAFNGCTSLSKLVIPNSVTSIGYSAFAECSSISSVTLGSNLKIIRDYAFHKCSALSKLTIPASVTSIGEYSFAECSSISNITLGSNLDTIGASAFRKCSALPKLTIPASVTSIGNYAFAGCTQLSDIQFADRTTTLQLGSNGSSGLFSDCPLNKVYLGGKISYGTSSIQGYSPFYNKILLSSLTIKGENTIYDREFYGCSAIQTLVIPASVTSIGDYAFAGCTQLSDIQIADRTTTLQLGSNGSSGLFSDCPLDKVYLGGKISYSTSSDKGYSPFYNKKTLSTLTIKGESTIYAREFYGCSSIQTLVIPASVTSIGNYAFAGCTQLSDIQIVDRTTPLQLGSNGKSGLFSDCPLDEVYIGGKITYNITAEKGYSPFYRNTSLRIVNITNRETAIYDNEFYGCTNLTDVIIGNDVSKIGDWAFSGCSSLSSFAFGTGVSSIGKEAFSDCTSLTKIVSLAQVPPTCGSQALQDINKWTCTLHVYKDRINDYQNADQWRDFFFIEDNAGELLGIEDNAGELLGIDTPISTDSLSDARNTTLSYSLDGRRKAKAMNKGIYIKNGHKVLAQ